MIEARFFHAENPFGRADRAAIRAGKKTGDPCKNAVMDADGVDYAGQRLGASRKNGDT